MKVENGFKYMLSVAICVSISELPYPPQAPKGFGARHTQSLILFICLTVAFTMRAQLSVSMVAMTSHNFGQAGNNIIENVTELHGAKRYRNVSEEKMMRPNESRYKGLSKWNVYRVSMTLLYLPYE